MSPSTARKSSSEPSDTDDSSDNTNAHPAAAPLQRASSIRSVHPHEKQNPFEKIRRQSIIIQFVAAGIVGPGTAAVIVWYCTGWPRGNEAWNDATGTLVVLLFVAGCSTCAPSWLAAVVMLFSRAPADKEVPPHAKTLRLCALLTLLLTTIYACLGLVLWVLLEDQASFRDFCLLNGTNMTAQSCDERWNRLFAILLAVALVFIYVVSMGFAVYRYTRGAPDGQQLEAGFLLEPSKSRRASRRSKVTSQRRQSALMNR